MLLKRMSRIVRGITQKSERHVLRGLSKFHETSVDSTTRAFATYLVSGELFPTAPQTQTGSSTQTEDGMDIDADPAEAQSTEEEVPTTTLTLVGEQDLERTPVLLCASYFALNRPLSPA